MPEIITIIDQKAPFVDPDGYPSWQPDATVRAMDVIARRVRVANRIAKAKANLVAAEQAVIEARDRLFKLIDELEDETLEITSRAPGI